MSAYLDFMACQDREVMIEDTGLRVSEEYPFIARRQTASSLKGPTRAYSRSSVHPQSRR